MAKIENVKARKEYKCSKCGETIQKGDSYFKGYPYMCKPIIRCCKCGIYAWELSSSDYIQSVGRLVDCWQDDYELGENTAQEIADELSNIQDECQDRLDNMPYGLQEGDTGQLLQERIDQLYDVISELESIDYESIREGELGDIDYESTIDETKEEMDTRIETDLVDAINEALGQLDY